MCLGPLADDGWRYIIEVARQSLRLEEAAEAVPKALIVAPQCRRELVGCAIPLPASFVGGGVDEVASVELAVFSEAAERRVQKRVQIDPQLVGLRRFSALAWAWKRTPSHGWGQGKRVCRSRNEAQSAHFHPAGIPAYLEF